MPGEAPVSDSGNELEGGAVSPPDLRRPSAPHAFPSDPPPTAALPWSGNPDFTRKEAADALLRKGHPPMTPVLAKQIAAAVLRGESPAEIAAAFGYAPSYATQVVNAPGVQARVKQRTTKLMDAAGLTLEDQIGKLKTLQSAEKVVTASHEGVITDERVYADNGVRLRALETGLDLHGAFPTKRQYGGPESGSRFTINIAGSFKGIFFGSEAGPDGAVVPEEVEEPEP